MTDPDSPTDRDDAPAEDGPDGSPAPESARRLVPRLADEGGGTDDRTEGAAPFDGEDGPPDPKPIEPEAPTPENALFVVLGVLGTVGLLATAIPGVL